MSQRNSNSDAVPCPKPRRAALLPVDLRLIARFGAVVRFSEKAARVFADERGDCDKGSSGLVGIRGNTLAFTGSFNLLTFTLPTERRNLLLSAQWCGPPVGNLCQGPGALHNVNYRRSPSNGKPTEAIIFDFCQFSCRSSVTPLTKPHSLLALQQANYSAPLWNMIVARNHDANRMIREIVASLLSCDGLELHVRPTNIPYPCLQPSEMGKVPKNGVLCDIRLRVLEVMPLQRKNHEEFGDGEMYQMCRVCVAHSTPGAREEMHHALLYIGGDLLNIYQAKSAGEVIFAVVTKHAMLDAKMRPMSILKAVFVRRAINFHNFNSRGSLPQLTLETNRQWPYANSLGNMLRDPSISETGSTTYFRLSLVLSCIIAQSPSTTMPIHLLSVGDVLQDTDRMMRAASSSTIQTLFTPPTLQQTLRSALGLTVRGVCRLHDLNDMVAHHSALSNKLVEFLGSATSANCGTMWASIPNFQLQPTEQPLEKQVPLLGRSGLLRCFSLVHRCPTPSGASITKLQSGNDRTDVFDTDAFATAIKLALRHLDVTPLSASPEAARLLDGFIMVSRKLRNTAVQEVSIHDVGLAFVLARAHAALCLRADAISSQDALVAIYLCEESFLARTGRSILSFSGQLSAGKSNLDLYAGLADFQQHIERLLTSHGVRRYEE